MKRTFQNVIILVSLHALFVLLCGCEEDRRVNVEYNICSELYRCDSEYLGPLATPVCFVMPNRHRDMIITFHTTEVFGFSESYGNAVASNDFLQPFGVDYTNDGLFDVIDLALSASATGLEVTTLYYSDDNDVLLDLAKSITGYQIGHYYFSALDYDNNVTCQGMIPEGKSTMFLSSNIKEVRIYSHIDPGLNNYWKAAPVPGNVAYESAYEIDTTTTVKVPNAGEAKGDEQIAVYESAAPTNRHDVKSDEQYDVNVFLSNFSEQNAFSNGFNVNDWNAEELVNFAFKYCKINKSWNGISEENVNKEYYYTITLDSVNDILHRFFGIILQTTEMSSVFPQVPLSMSSDGRNTIYYMNDRFSFLAADGESYNRLTIVKQAESLEDGNLRFFFDIYSLDIDEYLNDFKVGSDYYYLSPEQAAQNKHLTKTKSGVAVIRPFEYNGRHTYQLISYYLNP